MKPRVPSRLALLGGFAAILLGSIYPSLGFEPMTYKEIAMLLRNREQEPFILKDTARRKLLQPLSAQEEQALTSLGASPALLNALRTPELVMTPQSAAAYNEELRQKREATLRTQKLDQERERKRIVQQPQSGAFPPPFPPPPQAKPEANSVEGKPLNLKFDAVDGSTVDLAKMHGKVVLVQFWATWCGPCMQEVPHVVAAYKKYHEKGFEVVGISLDKKKDAMLKVIQEKEMTWPEYFDGKGWQNEISSSFNVQAIPALWLVNKHGIVVTTDARRNLDQQVDQLLQEL